MEHQTKDSLHNYQVDGMDRLSRLQHSLGMWSTDCLESQFHDPRIKRIRDTLIHLLKKI